MTIFRESLNLINLIFEVSEKLDNSFEMKKIDVQLITIKIFESEANKITVLLYAFIFYDILKKRHVKKTFI